MHQRAVGTIGQKKAEFGPWVVIYRGGAGGEDIELWVEGVAICSGVQPGDPHGADEVVEGLSELIAKVLVTFLDQPKEEGGRGVVMPDLLH
jgi:hypothetical protein